MSSYAIQWAITHVHNTTPVEQMVLTMICHHFSEERGHCWPSVALLARETHLARSTVNAALTSLEQAGLIQRDIGRGTSNRYTLPKYVRVSDTRRGGLRQAEIKEQRKDTKSKIKSGEGSPTHRKPAKEEAVETKPKTVAEVLASQKNYTAVDDAAVLSRRNAQGRLTSGVMVSQWRDWHGKYVQGFLPVIRGKEQGMLVAACKRLGEAAMPRATLAALQDWNGFVAFCKEQAGAFNCPAKPTVAFFLRYCELALAWADRDVWSQVGAAKSVQSIANVPTPPSPAPHNATLTLDDIHSVLGEL